MIIEKLEMEGFACNCYIVADEASQDAIVIDPGAGAPHIIKKVEDGSFNVKYIVLTHRHPDHIGALRAVKEATGAQIAIHADDADGLQRRISFGPAGPPPQAPPPAADRFLKDGDEIEIGALRFSVIHTPGHTPGGICLLVEDVLFSGDTLFYTSVGRTDMPGGNTDQLIQAIHTKLLTLPNETVVLPGHGPETTIGAEKKHNPFLR